MSASRTALVLACTALLGAAALAGPGVARAQTLTSKSLKITLRNGSRTGPMSILPLQCASYNGALVCQVTVTNPAGPLASAEGRRAEAIGLLGCNFITHSVAEGRAVVAQLTDPTTSALVTCGDTAGNATPGPAATVLEIDLSALRPSQSFAF